MRRNILIGTLIGILLLGMGISKSRSTEERFIRVAVLQNAERFDFSVRGRYQINDAKTKNKLEEGRSLRESKVSIEDGGIQIAQKLYSLQNLEITTSKDVTIDYKGQTRRYRGSVNIVIDKNKKLLVVNGIELEQYVRGVLYHEVTDKWPMEAMKAQAVATRTYALYQSILNKDQSFDVTSDIYSQVYGGRSAERYRTNIAVNRTKGEILEYEGKIIPAYFSSNCGGHTEDARELWEEDWPPMRGVPCEFCRLAPYSRWVKNYRSKEIQEELNESGYTVGQIKDIKIVERNESGRIRKLQILDRDGRSTTISGKKFRDIIGPNVIRSNNYEVVMKGWYFDLIGRGWGHGVGMCQWGAYEMSRQRHSYDEILRFYYPGTAVVNEYNHTVQGTL